MRPECRNNSASACLALLLVIALAGCGANGNKADGHSGAATSAVSKGSGFIVSLNAEPRVVWPNGTVALTLSVRNASGKDRTFEVGSPQLYDFAAFDVEWQEIWRWSSGQFFIQVVTPVTIGKGETRVYKVIWNVGGLTPMRARVEGYFLGLPDLKPRVGVEISAEKKAL